MPRYHKVTVRISAELCGQEELLEYIAEALKSHGGGFSREHLFAGARIREAFEIRAKPDAECFASVAYFPRVK